jgi:vancomycin permeability regulator SanA
VIILIYTNNKIFTLQNVNNDSRLAIVFGAGLWRNGSPTPVLRDRVAKAAELYFAGKVDKLLMSGDNRYIDYNEPAAMRTYALELGVADNAIVLDNAGRRTYDTCYRARAIFGLERAILISQVFHLPRAIFTCNMLGVDSVGVPADLQPYRKISLFYWNLRELPATLTAMLEIFVAKPKPVLGDPEPIFPTEAP